MKALDRLRALEISEKAREHEPSKLTKGGFGGFVSVGNGTSPNISPDTDGPRYRWLILEADGRRHEVCRLPEMDATELVHCYPGARLVPLPDAAMDALPIIQEQSELRV